MRDATTEARRATSLGDVLVTDPPRAAELGARLVDALDGHDFDGIVIWNSPESAVLAHLVGARRQLPVHRVVEVEGLVELIDERPRPTRVLALAAAFTRPSGWRALTSVVARTGGTVPVIAAVLDTAALDAARAEGHQVVALDLDQRPDQGPGQGPDQGAEEPS